MDASKKSFKKPNWPQEFKNSQSALDSAIIRGNKSAQEIKELRKKRDEMAEKHGIKIHGENND